MRSSLASTPWQHIDDASTRVNGQNQFCHIICNPYFSAYFTHPGEGRLTVIQILQRGQQLDFLLNKQTASWLDLFNTPMWVQRRIAGWSQNQVLTYREMDEWLQRDAASLSEQQ